MNNKLMLQEQNVNDYYTETYTYGGLGHYGIYTFTLNTYTASGNEPTQTVICRTLTDGKFDSITYTSTWFLKKSLRYQRGNHIP